MEFLNNIPPWAWLVAAIALLSLEVLGSGGFLLGSAIAAMVVASISWLSPPLDWTVQLSLFALGSLIFTLAYWKFFRRLNKQTDYPELNNRSAQHVGQSLVLTEDLPMGVGRVQIGDSIWKVRAEYPLTSGQRAKVVSYEGNTLIIQPAPPIAMSKE